MSARPPMCMNCERLHGAAEDLTCACPCHKFCPEIADLRAKLEQVNEHYEFALTKLDQQAEGCQRYGCLYAFNVRPLEIANGALAKERAQAEARAKELEKERDTFAARAKVWTTALEEMQKAQARAKRLEDLPTVEEDEGLPGSLIVRPADRRGAIVCYTMREVADAFLALLVQQREIPPSPTETA